MALKLNSSGGGSITLDPVSTANNFTIGINVPSTPAGNVVVSDASGNIESVGGTFTGAVTATSFNSITNLSSTTPVVAGTAAVGTSTTVARADHVHPAQTTVSGSAGSVGGLTGIGTATPLAPGTAAVGTSTLGAREDHRHASQTTVSGSAGSVGGLTGIATVAPLVAGTAAVGTSTLGARQDHVHPAQTTVSGNAGSLAGKTMQSGTGTGGTAVSFSPAFTNLATIGLSATTIDGYVAGISAISTTGFTVVTRTNAGAVSAQSFRWVAIGT